ncbi:MAG: deoxyribodipyrimidine photo-lyase [Acidimicrobiia bacterium]
MPESSSSSDAPATLVWLRRDLRLSDHEALSAAAARGPVAVMYVLDPVLLTRPSGPRPAFLAATLRALDADLGGALWIVSGRPADEVPAVARAVGADRVIVTEDFTPYGRRRDGAVRRALESHGIKLTARGTNYAVRPGTLVTKTGGPFKVFTPFRAAWMAHGWTDPLPLAASRWIAPTNPEVRRHGLDALTALDGPLPAWLEPGERGAERSLEQFATARLGRYDRERDLPGVDGTSRLGPHLRFGTIHPRTVLAALGGERADEVFRSEIAWREFYADVLLRDPSSGWRTMQPSMVSMRVDDDSTPGARDRFDAWCAGRTGYPIVDAGMRQLLAEGFMHNRVRMIVASFLVKDLHLPWQWGAGHFMAHLADGDLASNSHGWQWTAGTGTDAAPYFRIFNPVSQGEKFDPDGRYVRCYVPEVSDMPDKWVHQPWASPSGAPRGYPAPIVDHAVERAEALARLAETKRA